MDRTAASIVFASGMILRQFAGDTIFPEVDLPDEFALLCGWEVEEEGAQLEPPP
jgi:hypothetical protein